MVKIKAAPPDRASRSMDASTNKTGAGPAMPVGERMVERFRPERAVSRESATPAVQYRSANPQETVGSIDDRS